MVYCYAWGLLKIVGEVPEAEKLLLPVKNYKFFPFEHKGKIFTFDENIWNNVVPHDKPHQNAQTVMRPDIKQIEDAVLNDKTPWIIAFSDQQFAYITGEGRKVEMLQIPPSLYQAFSENFVEIGYDVIDSMGISAIANVGYTQKDRESFRGIAPVNQYGVFTSAQCAKKFADITSRIVIEHAPFFPVNLWIRGYDGVKKD